MLSSSCISKSWPLEDDPGFVACRCCEQMETTGGEEYILLVEVRIPPHIKVSKETCLEVGTPPPKNEMFFVVAISEPNRSRSTDSKEEESGPSSEWSRVIISTSLLA